VTVVFKPLCGFSWNLYLVYKLCRVVIQHFWGIFGLIYIFTITNCRRTRLLCVQQDDVLQVSVQTLFYFFFLLKLYSNHLLL